MDQTSSASNPITINAELAKRIQDELGENVYLCYQCIKCSSGCPVGEFFDWQPNQIMRALQLGEENIALRSKTPWLCASCETCSTRCPQGLDIARIMEFLTREAKTRGIKPGVSEVNIFNEAFIREIHMWGRAYEIGLMAETKLRNRNFTDDLDLGMKMLARNKLPFLPTPTRPPRKVKPVPGAATAVGYYPGCSLHSTSAEYNESALAASKAIGLNLVEAKGWVCCGSSPAHKADPEYALRLPMENLSIYEQSGFKEVTMPCAACFNRHKAALYEIRKHEDHKARLDEQIGYPYKDTLQVTTLIESINNHIGAEAIANKVVHPLKGLNVVCYYGCLLTRPPKITGVNHPDNPTDMDEIMAALGLTVHDWSYKTVCCGAAHSLDRPEIVHKLSSNLIEHARTAGADAIVVACPLCHTNLDARQFQMKLDQPTPVFFFSQLMVLALGLPLHSAMLNKNIVDPLPLLKEKGLLHQAV